jgi:uncharacterized cupredoxin-like copper-binding protein
MKLIHAFAAALALTVAAQALPALAHGEGSHAKPATKKALSTTEHPWGREGDPAKATRTVRITMSDAMRYTPDRISVRKGETLTLEVSNGGKVMHELVIGTEAELKAHAELMKKHPGMEHDEPYMAHVAPGKRERITWQFTQPGEFLFGCLLPGHFEAGMIGRITVKP